ncbi:cytochrome b [Burkholderia sp. MR1-5-21]
MQIDCICIVVDEDGSSPYDALLIDGQRRTDANHSRFRRPTGYGLTSLDLNMRVNRMSQATMPGDTHRGEPYTVTTQEGPPGRCNVRRPTSVRALDRYDGLARFFHWTFAAGIIYASIAGYTLARLGGGPVREFLSQLNMSIGTVLTVIFPFRVGWKLVRIEPRALPGVSARQQSVARIVHGVIYVTIFAVLASGYLMVPNGYSFFGLVDVHTPFKKGPLTDELFVVHRASCALLAGLVMLHVLAVIKHQLVKRADVLRRML